MITKHTTTVTSIQKKTVYILIGPKGSGKSHIGMLLQNNLGMKFLRVEPLLIEYIRQFGLPEGGLERDGFDLEERAIRDILATENSVIFEATGTSVFFPSVLENLGQSFNIKLVRIHCPLGICYQRIEERDQDGQFYVSDEMVKSINERAVRVTFDWDLESDNSAPASNDDIVSQFSEITG